MPRPPSGGERSNAAPPQRRRAKQCRRGAGSPPPSKRHSRATECARLIDASKRRGSWRSHVHRTYTAQRVQSFKPQTANANFLWVGLREGYLFLKRDIPPLSVQRQQALPPPPPPTRGDKQKGSPYRLPFLKFAYSTVTDFARFLGLSISHPRWSAI